MPTRSSRRPTSVSTAAKDSKTETPSPRVASASRSRPSSSVACQNDETPDRTRRSGARLKSGNDLLSQAVTHQVPSAQEGLTSEFEMESGGTPPLWSPENCSAHIDIKSRVPRFWRDNSSADWSPLVRPQRTLVCQYGDKPSTD